MGFLWSLRVRSQFFPRLGMDCRRRVQFLIYTYTSQKINAECQKRILSVTLQLQRINKLCHHYGIYFRNTNLDILKWDNVQHNKITKKFRCGIYLNYLYTLILPITTVWPEANNKKTYHHVICVILYFKYHFLVENRPFK